MLIAITTALVLVLAVAQPAAAKKRGPVAAFETSASATATGDGSTASATASCPPGTKVAGGGFYAPYSYQVIPIVYESVMAGKREWRSSVQLLDPSGASTLTLTTYAYCRPGLPSVKAATQSAQTTGELGLGPSLEASCPGDSAAIAGGFQMPPPLSSGLVSALLFDSAASSPNSWTSRYVTGTVGAVTVSSEVYCDKRDEAPTEVAVSSASNNSDFSSSSATADCPAGTNPVAGGFAQPDANLASFFLVYESRRDGDSWRVSGLHTGNDPAATLSSAAYCA